MIRNKKEPGAPGKRFHNPVDIFKKYDILFLDGRGELQPRVLQKTFSIDRGRYLATASLRRTMAGYTEDKRRFPRVRYRTPLRYQIRGQSHFRDVETADLSVSGLSFTDDAFLPLNTPLKLELNLPYNKTIRSEGKIVRTAALPHSDSYFLAVEFLNTDRREMQYLDKLLSNQTY